VSTILIDDGPPTIEGPAGPAVERVRRDYDQLTKQLVEVGFICEGSVTRL
jgi:hypothetical protein